MSEDVTSVEMKLRATLEALEVPYANETLGALKAIRHLKIDENGVVTVEVVLGYPINSIEGPLKAAIVKTLRDCEGVFDVSVTIQMNIEPHAVQSGVTRLVGVRNIVAVTSGKGGVGKSTTAVNLAAALSLEGASVGILDADIHGPSLPKMLGVLTENFDQGSDIKMSPVEVHGLKMMSVGLLVDADTPIIWRGPMITQVFEKLLNQTDWGKLDYLIVDMPPGTGDIQITLAQRVPLTGVVIVTTPQAVAVDDASRCLNMFRRVRVPVIGLIENMSLFCCPCCQTETSLFGKGGGEEMERRYDVELLGQLPINPSIGAQTEAGTPILLTHPEDPVSQRYRSMALRIAAKVATLAKDRTGAFPKIVVEKNA